MKKVIVIGGGASGLFAAGWAAKSGNEVLLIEKNKITGRKLLLTGKGRCNVTNNCTKEELLKNIPVNGNFLYSAFSRFDAADTMAFFESLGVKLKTERGNRVFPESDRSADIVNALRRFISAMNVKVITATVAAILYSGDKVSGVKLADGSEIACDAVIVCTGGMSYPTTGSIGDGYRFAREAGHTIIPPKPSLVPLESSDEWVKELAGLTLRNVAIELVDTRKNKPIYTDFGEMLFTHFGVSGPVVLSASSHIREFESGKYKLCVDLKPALSEEQLDLRLQRDFGKFSNRNFSNSLDELLPRKLIPVMVSLSGIAPDTKVHQITRAQRLSIAKLLKSLTITISAMRPIDEAVITSGGVKVSEISPSTMQSKLKEGLYFAGEVLDVDAYTGGFNLQIAFSTGYIAGTSV